MVSMKHLVLTSFEEMQKHMGVLRSCLQEACTFSLGRYCAEDLISYIQAGHMQLWLAFTGECLDGFLLTQIIPYPQTKAVRFLCCMGVDIDNWLEFIKRIGDWVPYVEQIEDWARGLGCTLSQIECPAPWELYMRDLGYKRGHVLLDKELAA